MKALDIATITASLEKSLQNFSLNNRNDDLRKGRSSSISDNSIESVDNRARISETSVELNSHQFLPHHFEQCLDLKTGEIYYINRKNGMKVTSGEYSNSSSLYSEEDSSCDSEESWYGSSPSSTEKEEDDDENDEDDDEEDEEEEEGEGDVLVVAGCKTCFMYYMVPKFAEHCPKCSHHLLHFDRPLNASS